MQATTMLRMVGQISPLIPFAGPLQPLIELVVQLLERGQVSRNVLILNTEIDNTAAWLVAVIRGRTAAESSRLTIWQDDACAPQPVEGSDRSFVRGDQEQYR